MKWIGIGIGLLVGAVLLMALIGMLLPRGHVATVSARFRQTPEVLWSAIGDYASFPQWRPDVERVETVEGRHGEAWREIWTNRQVITIEITESERERRLVTRIADPDLPFGGTWTYEITPVDGGSLLRITENGEVYNPIFRFMSRFVFGHTAGMESYLRALGQKFSEEVVPE